MCMHTSILFKNFLCKVLNDHRSPDEKLRDLCDGGLFSTNFLLTASKDSIQIQLYYDDVEVCNPLGSKAKIHKLGTCGPISYMYVYHNSYLIYLFVFVSIYRLVLLHPDKHPPRI